MQSIAFIELLGVMEGSFTKKKVNERSDQGLFPFIFIIPAARDSQTPEVWVYRI